MRYKIVDEPYLERNGSLWKTIGTTDIVKHIRFQVLSIKHILFSLQDNKKQEVGRSKCETILNHYFLKVEIDLFVWFYKLSVYKDR